MNQEASIKEMMAGKLKVNFYENRTEMGRAAAKDVGEKIKTLQAHQQGNVNIIFAAAPSQNEFLYHLAEQNGIEWSRVDAFHMDEYVGLRDDSAQRFAYFLQKSIFDNVPINTVHYINGNAKDVKAECNRYAALLEQYPPDIVCMGIGENTHLAFNDPHTADFNDPFLVKEVTLDQVSRQQQVHDGCFAALSAVPTSAITLTIPALLMAKSIYCIVPGRNKAPAVYHTLNNEETERYPSTSLKKHADAKLYLDKDSAERLGV